MERREGFPGLAMVWETFLASSSLGWLALLHRPWPPAPLEGGRPPGRDPWCPALLEGGTPPDLLHPGSAEDGLLENLIRLLVVFPSLLLVGELPSLLRLRLKRERPAPGEGMCEIPGLELELLVLPVLLPPPGSLMETFSSSRPRFGLSVLERFGISSSLSMMVQFFELVRPGPFFLDVT